MQLRKSRLLGSVTRQRDFRQPRRLSLESLETRSLCTVNEFYSFDGTGNNLSQTEWGSTGEQLLRKAPAEYADGIFAPAGANRPGAREISNRIVTHPLGSLLSDRGLTPFVYVWGQFLNHDMDLTGPGTVNESFPIPVPQFDNPFDLTGTGTQTLPLRRSIFDAATGTSTSNPRQQIDQITAWIDGSMIYGSDSTRAAALRSFVDGKLLVTSSPVGDLPPLNTAGLPNLNQAHRVPDNQLYLSGDIRANENIQLTAMHTLFIREHNRLAEEIAAANPGFNDQQIFDQARAWVIAEIQSITYNQLLPALLGEGALKAYSGYKSSVNPNIANEFSTAAFRLHSSLLNVVQFFDNDGQLLPFSYVNDAGQTVQVAGEISLVDAFSNPTLFRQVGLDGMMKYFATVKMEEIDTRVVSSLRNFLFAGPGQGGFDLAAINIQRGRDHGLADYNDVRKAFGLKGVDRFSKITADRDVRFALEELYGNTKNIDLWVGLLAEDHVSGASVGPTTQRILVDQFQRLRDGDRLWYQRLFSGAELAMLEQTTLADILERNTGVVGLQENVFIFKAEVSGVVFIDQDQDGIQDGNEEGRKGVTVQLLNQQGAVIETQATNRKGKFQFTDFSRTGNYQVRIVVPSGMTATTPSFFDFSLTMGDQWYTGVQFGLRS